MTQVINFLNGPGVGKSTTAAGLFYRLKKAYISCELVQEYAKDKTWEGSQNVLANQIYVFAKQYHRMWRLKDKVDYIITDSPLLLSLVYNKYVEGEDVIHHFNSNQLFMSTFRQFQNMNYLIERQRKYIQVGRNQTEEEAREVDETVKTLLNQHLIPHKRLPSNMDAAIDEIIRDLGLEGKA